MNTDTLRSVPVLHRPIRRSALLLALSLLVVPVLAGCTQPPADTENDAPTVMEGSSEMEHGDPQSEAGGGEPMAADDMAEPEAELETMTPDGREIVRVTLSEYAITTTHTTFQTGVPYRLVIADTGVISHELRVLPRGESETAMAAMGGMHGAEMHDHGNQMLFVSGETLEPGRIVERDLIFTEPAEMELACHLPGHFESGMILDIDVVGDPVDITIRAADITYDPDAMKGMACHAMNTTIMGDCSPADVLRITQEILAASDAAAAAAATGGDDHADEHDEGMDEDSMGEMGAGDEEGEGAGEDDHGHDEGADDDHGHDEGGGEGDESGEDGG